MEPCRRGPAACFCIALVDFLRAFPIPGSLGRDRLVGSSSVGSGDSSEQRSIRRASFIVRGLVFPRALTYGSRVTSLLASVVPRIFWPERPGDIYSHHAASVGIVEGVGEQGSHPSRDRMVSELRPARSRLRGIVWGWIWSRCFNAYQAATANRDRGPRWQYVLAVLAPRAFVAYIPPLIRAGLEGYKGC